jgi:hypothetical protein
MPPDPLLIAERLGNVQRLLEHIYDATCSDSSETGIRLCEVVERLCVKQEGARWKLRIAKQSSGPVKRELLFDLKKSVEELELAVEWIAHSDLLRNEPQSIAVM